MDEVDRALERADFYLTMDGENQTSERSDWRYRQHHRSLVPPRYTECNGLAERAIKWILPWSIYSYPGIWRGVMELLGGYWKKETIRAWRNGRRKMPVEAARLLADYIENRCVIGLAIVAELNAYIASRANDPYRNKGFMVVRDRTGSGVETDARFKGGRKRSTPKDGTT